MKQEQTISYGTTDIEHFVMDLTAHRMESPIGFHKKRVGNILNIP